jgi:type I restriction enzyme, R subunit
VVSPPASSVVVEIDIETVTEAVVERIKTDRTLAERVAQELIGKHAFFAIPSVELIAGEETYAVEFKSTARWNVREERKDRRMEDAIVKTVAGFLNADGGTLLIGVDDQRTLIGLQHDVVLVKPPNADGLVNWLTTHLIEALSHTAVSRIRARIDDVQGVDICRVDVAPSSRPIHACMSDKTKAFWVRMNNSTRALPEIEIEDYVRDHW